MISIWINDIDYSDYVSSFVITSSSSKNNIIGNVTSCELKVSLDNSNDVFNESILSNPIIIKKDDRKNGIYNILDKPEKMTKELSITAYDNVIFTGIEYNSQLDYESGLTTIKDLLDEISSIIGITINYNDLDNSVLNRTVMNYDNTVTIREYLSMIGEIGGCNVNASPDGSITFKKINKNVIHNLYENDVEKFETIETFDCTMVAFDNGVIDPIKKGNDSGNTIYVSNDNMFIDSQDQIDYLYSILNGLSFISVKDFKNVEIENLQIGDIVNYNDEFSFIALSVKTTFYNAEYNVQEISGEISTKQASIVESRNPTDVKIKRLKTLIDQNNANLKILSEQQKETSQTISQLEIGLNGIKSSVESTSTEVKTIKEALGIEFQIESSLGYSFESESVNDTTLTARIFKEGEDIDPEGRLTYTWYCRHDGNSDEDILGTGKSIILKMDHFVDNALIYFTADDGPVSTSSVLGKAILGYMVLNQS